MQKNAKNPKNDPKIMFSRLVFSCFELMACSLKYVEAVSLVVNTRVMVHPTVACEGHSRMFYLVHIYSE